MLIRMLQVIGVISLVSACVLFTHFLVPRSPNAQKIERGPRLSILEQFRRTDSGSEEGGEKARTPLVVQAGAFALYLNPPKRKEVSAPRSNARKTVVAVRTTKSKPKFVLAATSYYQSRPEKSMGLVLEPGSGYRWVKQGERVGHFVVERIEPGLITYRNGDKLLEMAIKADINVIAPDTGRTTIASASSQASTALFARSNTRKPNSVTRKAVRASGATGSKARPTANRQVAVKTREIAPVPVKHSVYRSRSSGSLKSNKVMRKTTPRPNSARPQMEQTSYQRRKNRV